MLSIPFRARLLLVVAAGLAEAARLAATYTSRLAALVGT